MLFFGVALFSGEDHRRERPSKQIGRVMFLFLSLLCSHSFALACERIEKTIVSHSLLMRCSLFSNALSRCNDNNNTIKQSSGPPPEKIVTLAGIIAPRMVGNFWSHFLRAHQVILFYIGTKRRIVRGRTVRVSIERSVTTRVDWGTGDV